MRWKAKEAPELHARRERTFFAWKPVQVKGEVRWLELVIVAEEYYGDGHWHAVEFYEEYF